MSRTKKQLISEQNKKEIFYQIINALLVGFISFLSALVAAGEITGKVCFVALLSSMLVLFIAFKKYWDGEASEYTAKLFMILN